MSPNIEAINLDTDQRILLQQFRSAVSDVLKPEHDNKFLLRFLKSRDFDLKKTEKMLRESFKFKKKIDAEDLLNSGYQLPDFIEKHIPTKFFAFDKDGSPMRSFLAGVCDMKGFAHSLLPADMMKVLIYILESDLQRAREYGKETGKYHEQSVYILDFSGFNFRQFCDKTVLNAGIQLIVMYQDNYPELLKAAYIVNAPHYFYWVLNLFKPFIHERTMSKIKIFKTDDWKNELSKIVDKKLLPVVFGGELDDPEHDPKVRPMINGGTKVPTKHYLKGTLSLRPTDPGIKQVSIRERSKFEHKVDVAVPGSIIKWIFQTKDYNVKFALFFKNSSYMKSKSRVPVEELLPLESVESQTVPERGEFLCEKAGQYILHFDNSYSWLTGKQLLYKVEVEEPAISITEE